MLAVINSSPGYLAPVFEAILEKAHTLCGAPLGSLVLLDGEQLRAVATRGYPQGYETLARQGFSPIPPFQLLLRGEPFVHVQTRRCSRRRLTKKMIQCDAPLWSLTRIRTALFRAAAK